jgi:hypothetical protein
VELNFYWPEYIGMNAGVNENNGIFLPFKITVEEGDPSLRHPFTSFRA